MTSETDEQFLDSMEQWVIGSLVFKCEHRERLFALARRGAAVQWRPIEEAPEQTIHVLMFTPEHYHPKWDGADYGIVIGYYENGEWRDQGTNHNAFEYKEPTHWMPLPPPPAGKPRDE